MLLRDKSMTGIWGREEKRRGEERRGAAGAYVLKNGVRSERASKAAS